MYEMEFHFRSHYYEYCKGIYNSAELLFMTVHIMKGFELYDLDVKSLVELVRDAVKKAFWRKDIYVYDGWSRQAHFSFLSKYDDSESWHEEEEVSVYDEIETIYRPIDVVNTIIKHWRQLYADPCIYPALIHILEASDNLFTPKNFDQRIRYFICNASKKYDATRGLTNNESSSEASYELKGEPPFAITYAKSLMGSAAKGAASSLERMKR